MEDKRRPSVGRFTKAAKNGYQTVLSNGFILIGVEEHYTNDQFPKE
jgi:hypothetical protein